MNISEVCQEFGITQDTLRYYEKIGLLPKVARTKGGIRSYSQNDCKWIEFIKCMRTAGISVEKLIEYVNLFNQGPETVYQRKQILIEERQKIFEKIEFLQKTLAKLDSKIENYENTVLNFERTLLQK